MMTGRLILIFAAVSGFIFVALGAFGAHGLSKILDAQQMAWLRTGLEYQGLHTLAILALGIAVQHQGNIWFQRSATFLALGTILFSGSLYWLALSTTKMWVYITPIGGFCFLIGWALLLVGALRQNKKV
ncbi:membrane protein [Budvicia aquatica]|nr:membrane protein [Budvicia aquatica]